MPVAPPETPGHVGHTPQHVGEAVVRSRLRGIETSGVVAAMIDEARPLIRFFMGALPNPQRYGHVSSVHALAAADEYSRRQSQLAPWLRPVDKWPGAYETDRLPLPFIEKSRQARG